MAKPRLMVATRNRHKTAEIREMVGDRFEVLDANDIDGLPTIEETGDSFLANATLKAVGISRHVDGLVLSDDSGLEVDALDGAPGVWSSSFGGEEGNHALNNERLLRELDGVPDGRRGGRFRCVMVIARDGRVLADFDGCVEGRLLAELRGKGGFGYDPLFVPEGHDRTFAELGDTEKNRLSHRARALARAVAWLEQDRSGPDPR
jgi:XTP/dITP diphosphohydrolase